MVCKECDGKKYRIARRSDGCLAVERCDTCCWHGDNDPRTIWDEDAAKLARIDGVICDISYPCYVRDRLGYKVTERRK